MHTKSATEIRDLFLQGTYSAEQITSYFLDRIEKLNPELGAFTQILRERALKKARLLDEKKASGAPLGPLTAVPIAIKDNMHIKGEITTCGSKFLTNYRAPFSATVTELLEEADAILVGKTNLDEFAMGSSNENSAISPCSNPWDIDKIPGGSSGGSAAAVAARMVPLSLGSDTGGSIRQPAALCGVTGFKPTYGRVSRYGLVAFGSSLDQIGPFAHSAKDIALIMQVLGRHCEKDSTSLQLPPETPVDSIDIEGKTIGIPYQFLHDLDKEAKLLFDQSIEKIQQLGAKIVEVDLQLLQYSVAIYYILATAEASTNLARFDGVRYGRRSEKAQTLDQVYDLSKQEGFGPEVKRRIMLGTYVLSAGYQDAYYKKAQKVRQLVIEQYKKAFQSCDLVAMPTTSGTAFAKNSVQDPLKMYLQDVYTIGANLAGLPAISIPSGFLEAMPYGLQLIGPQKADSLVYSIGEKLSQALGAEVAIPSTYQNERKE